jgi:hypothetical protein
VSPPRPDAIFRPKRHWRVGRGGTATPPLADRPFGKSFLAFGNDVSIEEADEMECSFSGRLPTGSCILNDTPRAGNLSLPWMIRRAIPYLLLGALIESLSGESEAL